MIVQNIGSRSVVDDGYMRETSVLQFAVHRQLAEILLNLHLREILFDWSMNHYSVVRRFDFGFHLRELFIGLVGLQPPSR
jgi:hypothetical protein